MPYRDTSVIEIPDPGIFDDLSDPESLIPMPDVFDDLSDEPTSRLARTAPSGPLAPSSTFAVPGSKASSTDASMTALKGAGERIAGLAAGMAQFPIGQGVLPTQVPEMIEQGRAQFDAMKQMLYDVTHADPTKPEYDPTASKRIVNGEWVDILATLGMGAGVLHGTLAAKIKRGIVPTELASEIQARAGELGPKQSKPLSSTVPETQEGPTASPAGVARETLPVVDKTSMTESPKTAVRPETPPEPITSGKQPWETTQREYIDKTAEERLPERREYVRIGEELASLNKKVESGASMTSAEMDLMSRLEARERAIEELGIRPKSYIREHAQSVEQALKNGEAVSPAVLADYPDLAAKYGKQPSEKIGQLPTEGPTASPAPLVTLGDVMIEVAPTMKAPGFMQFFTTPSNYVGAIPGTKARFGPVAAEAVARIELGERNFIVDFGSRQERLKTVIDKIDPADYGKTGEDFWQSFEGRPIEEIIANPELQASTKEGAQSLRTYFEDTWVSIRDNMREVNRPWVEKAVTAEYRQELGLKRGEKLGEAGGPARTELSKRVNAKLAEMVPEEAPISDYLPHVFEGDFLIRYEGANGWETVGSAKTEFQAKGKIWELANDLGEGESKSFRIDRKEFVDTDMVLLSRGNYFRLKSALEKSLDVGKDEIGDAMRGKIGMRQARSKFFGFIKPRTGAKGYITNLEEAVTVYNAAVSRYLNLSQMSRDVIPMIEGIRKTGNAPLADYVQKVFDQAWGKKQDLVSLAFDNSLKGLGLGRFVKPFALDRWTSALIKWPVATFKWKLSPRAQLLNLFQPYQETLAVVDAASFVKGEAFYHSAAGKIALEENGIRFFSAGKLREAGPSFTGARLREKMGALAPETRNQELAWCVVYKKGLDMGMSPKAASDYAFLRGNVFTQFVHLKSDVPPIMRGPIGSTLLMFKRFQVKDLELGFDILRRGDFPAAGKYFGAKALMGGFKALTHPVTLMTGGGYLTLETYRKLKEKYGQQTANFIAYGLPGLVGIDMSYSVQMASVPTGNTVAEKLGEVVLGAPGSSFMQVAKAAADTEGTEPSALIRTVESLKQTNPGIGRLIDGIYKLAQGADDQGMYDFRTPSGKLRYKDDLKGLVIYALGGKTINNQIEVDGEIIDDEPFDLWAESNMEMMARRSATMDRIVSNAVKNDDYDMWGPMDDWNQKWPEFPIDFKSLRTRLKSRKEVQTSTQKERMLGRTPRGMQPYYEDTEE